MNIPDINDLSRWVTIGITTKNRWDDLEITLKKIVEAGLSSLKIIIFDDGSDQACPFNMDKISANLELKTFQDSQGLIVRRNQLANMIRTKYYLSLDDDSFPVNGSLEQAVDFAESLNNNFLCLSFPIFNPVLGKYQSKSQSDIPYKVRSFIGCGHLLHCQNFLSLGGYREELIHQGEEIDISVRGFVEGLYCYHFPGFNIHHTASNVGRNWHRMDYYGARNNLLWNDWFVPLHLSFRQQIRTIISRLGLSLQVRRWGQLQGMLSALREMNAFKHYRHPLSCQLYSEWKSLPYN